MAFLLRSSANTDLISLSQSPSLNATDDFAVEFKAQLAATTFPGLPVIANTAASDSGFDLVVSGTEATGVKFGNSTAISFSTNVEAFLAPVVWTIQRVSGQLSVIADGVTVLGPVANSRDVGEFLGRIMSRGGGGDRCFIGDTYYFKFSKNSTLLYHWDASASSGTGSTLPDIVGTNDATLSGTFATDGSQWISTAASPSLTVTQATLTPGGTISGTYADYATIPTTLTVSDGTNTITIANPGIVDDAAGGGTFSGTMPALPTTGTANLVLFGNVTVSLT